jgi:hypothetical protein
MDLAAARTLVLEHLDDDQKDRWSDAQIDKALAYSLSACLDEYLTAGGERLDLVTTQSSNTSGEADLSTFNPLDIKNVNLVIGSRYWPIQPVTIGDKNVNDGEIKTLEIKYVPKLVLPTTTTHPLVGNGATAYNSWDQFENWICLKAALFASIKDAEDRPEIKYLEQEARSGCLSHPRIPKALPFPLPSGYYSKWYAWYWDQQNKKLIVSRQWG